MNPQIDYRSQCSGSSGNFMENTTILEKPTTATVFETVTDVINVCPDTTAPYLTMQMPLREESQDTTATKLPVNQGSSTTEFTVNQDTSTSYQPNELLNPDTTATEVPVNEETTATSTILHVNQEAITTEVTGSKNTTATEFFMNQDTQNCDLPVNGDITAPELLVLQVETATKLSVNQDTTVTEIPIAASLYTKTNNTAMTTSSDSILPSTNLDGAYSECLVDKVDSCVEPILIDDDLTVDESTSIGSGASNGLQRNKVCELCGLTVAIYTCPGCHVKTCSLRCVKEHKRRFFCNGERNKTAFVDISEYSESHMLNDYRFLEDANRQVYSNKIEVGNKRKHNFGGPNHLTKRSKLLVNAAYKRGVKVQMVAQVLTKHKLNTSYYTVRLDLISWHIEWLFVTSNTVVKDEKVPENTILIDAARKWTNAVNHPELRKPLEDYKKENLDKSRFLLKIDCLPANRQRYFEMKANLSIAENLKGHCLTEFPIIAVLPPSYPKSEDFILFSSADLLFMDPANRRHVMTNLQEMNFQTDLIAQLMDPKSHIYSTQSDAINID